MLKWDGHTHTPFCPHGSKDSLVEYIERAIADGFQIYSITEHAPLPASFIDPSPGQDSAMRSEDIEAYLTTCQEVKEKYRGQIEIKIGLEVDYIAGFEEETKEMLDTLGPSLDDALLSVHFMYVNKKWACIDYSPDHFEKNIVNYFPSVDHVYAAYYELVYQSVTADLGKYKPKRIGHLSLVEKFKKKFPYQNKDIWWDKVLLILQEIKKRGYQLDFNTAGLQKPLCKEVYPALDIVAEAKKLGIPFVYGSDSHVAKHVGHHYQVFAENVF